MMERTLDIIDSKVTGVLIFDSELRTKKHATIFRTYIFCDKQRIERSIEKKDDVNVCFRINQTVVTLTNLNTSALNALNNSSKHPFQIKEFSAATIEQSGVNHFQQETFICLANFVKGC